MKLSYIRSQKIEQRIYQNHFQKHLKNVKKTWNSIKSIVTLKSKDKTAPNLLIVNGNVIINKSYIAEIFNDFFVNVGSNLASKIPIIIIHI